MSHPHLSDDRIFDVCVQHAPAAADEVQHLASCARCGQRRERLSGLVAGVSAVMSAEADVLFTDARLERQRARILQRVEQEAQHGRVITFPAGHGQAPARRTHPGMRWIAGAAAAGLLIGVVAGHLAHDFTASQIRPAEQVATDSEVATLQAVSTMSDEEFLGRLELALEGTAGTSLRPLDDLTPLVWEVAAAP